MIRDATPDDAADIAAIYAPYVRDTAVSFEEDVPDASTMAARIAAAISWVVCERDGDIVGYAYAGPFATRAAYRWSVEVSTYVHAEARRTGVGGEMLDALLPTLRRAGYVHAFAGTTLPNPGSVALFGSRGFEQVATYRAVGCKLGRWHDVAWLQLELQPPAVPPPRIITPAIGSDA